MTSMCMLDDPHRIDVGQWDLNNNKIISRFMKMNHLSVRSTVSRSSRKYTTHEYTILVYATHI